MSKKFPVLLALVLTTGCQQILRPTPAPVPRARVVLISCDGLGANLEARMHALRQTPTLDAMALLGARARYAITSYPSKTAAGHASIWTGAYGDRNGITGNLVPMLPARSRTVLQDQTGFSAWNLTAEPIWVDAARHGLRTWVLPAPQSGPVGAYGPTRWGKGLAPSALVDTDLYGASRTADAIVDQQTPTHEPCGWQHLPPGGIDGRQLAFTVEGNRYWGLFYHDDSRKTPGYNALLVRHLKERAGGVVLYPDPPAQGIANFAGPFPVLGYHGMGAFYLRLFALDATASRFKLYVSQVNHPEGNGPDARKWLSSVGPLIYGGAQRLYTQGRFGLPAVEGGDGRAEDRYLETIILSLSTLRHAFHSAMAQPGWQLMVGYIPFPDEVEHLWYGLTDPHSAAYRPRVAKILLPRLERVVRMVDATLGAVRRDLPCSGVLAVTSDHGFQGINRRLFPNVALARAGLLRFLPDGRIDLAHTRILYPPDNSEYLLVNTMNHRGGIVPLADRPRVVQEAIAALAPLRGPHSHRLFAGLFVPSLSSPLLGLGGPEGGDLYLDPAPGLNLAFTPSKGEPRSLLLPEDPLWSGNHGMNPMRSGLHAIFFLAGHGVRRGVQVGPIRTVDEAPTLCRLLDIPPPDRAEGQSIVQMLSQPAR